MALVRVKIDKNLSESVRQWIFEVIHSSAKIRPPCHQFGGMIGTAAESIALREGLRTTLLNFLGTRSVVKRQINEFIDRIFFQIDAYRSHNVEIAGPNFPVYIYTYVEYPGEGVKLIKFFINTTAEFLDRELDEIVAERDEINDDLEVIVFNHKPATSTIQPSRW